MNTKEKLISSAIKLFSEKGFEATSTTAICSDAGFSSGALFVHFKTKNDLLDYIYLSIKRESFRQNSSTSNTNTDMFTMAENSALASGEYYCRNPEKFFFIKKFLNSQHLSRITKEEIDKELKPIFDFYNRGKMGGHIIDIDNQLLFDMLSGAYYGLIEYSIKSNNKITREHIRRIFSIIKK